MSSEVSAVEKVLQVYFDGLYEGDTGKLGQAFHPASHLYAAGGDGKASDWQRAGRSHRVDRFLRPDHGHRQGRMPAAAALLHRLSHAAQGRRPLADHLED